MDKEILKLLKSMNDRVPNDVNSELLDSGIIDSFDIVNIVSEMENKFAIDIAPEDIVPENFYSVKAMATMMEKYLRNKR